MCIAATVFISLSLLLDDDRRPNRQNMDYVNALQKKGVVIVLVSEWGEDSRYDVENRLCLEGLQYNSLLFGIVGKPVLATTNFSGVSLSVPRSGILESHLQDIVD